MTQKCCKLPEIPTSAGFAGKLTTSAGFAGKFTTFATFTRHLQHLLNFPEICWVNASNQSSYIDHSQFRIS